MNSVNDVQWLDDLDVWVCVGHDDGVEVFYAVCWQMVVYVGCFDSVFAWGACRRTCVCGVGLLIGKRCWEGWFRGEYGLVVERERRDFWFREELVEGLVCVVW